MGATVAAERTEVKAGQVWQYLDKRLPNRFIQVMELNESYAICRAVMFDEEWIPAPRIRVQIRLDRFRPGCQGYGLIEGRENDLPLPDSKLCRA